MNSALNKISSILAVGAALTAVTVAHAVSFNYASDPSAAINFAGNSTFSITGTPGHIFQVTSGTANSLLGDITGTYTIGAVSGISAPVTGNGQFIVHDGAFDFTANITWVDITQTGALGGLNVLTASVN